VLRVVLDTVIFVRTLINPKSICGRIVVQGLGEYRLFVSQPVLVEILEVLQRPEITRKISTLGALDLKQVMAIISQAEAVELSGIPPVCRDPADDKFLATAEAAQADYLVTEDQDLLVLEEYHGTAIVDAATFLQILADQAGN